MTGTEVPLKIIPAHWTTLARKADYAFRCGHVQMQDAVDRKYPNAPADSSALAVGFPAGEAMEKLQAGEQGRHRRRCYVHRGDSNRCVRGGQCCGRGKRISLAVLMDFIDKQIPPPKSWEKFEDLIRALFAAVWASPLAQKNGRSGQEQHGVDVYGTPKDAPGKTLACSARERTKATGPERLSLSSMRNLLRRRNLNPRLGIGRLLPQRLTTHDFRNMPRSCRNGA